MNSWEIWLEEFLELDYRLHLKPDTLSVRDEHQHEYLRNIIEAALGTKQTLIEDNRRTEPRIPVVLPCLIVWEGGGAPAFTVNISWGGISLDDTLPPEADRVHVAIVLEREGLNFEAAGRVAWRRDRLSGISFDPMTEEQKIVFSEILAKTLRERLVESRVLKSEINLSISPVI